MPAGSIVGIYLSFLIIGLIVAFGGLLMLVRAMTARQQWHLVLGLFLTLLGSGLTAGSYRLWHNAGHEPVWFMEALAEGNFDRVNQLLDYHPKLAHQDMSPWGYPQPPLHLAIMSGKSAILVRVLKEKPNLEQSDQAGDTALLLAVRLNYPLAAELLLDQGANPEAIDAKGKTAGELAHEQLGRMGSLFLNPNQPTTIPD